MARTGRKKTKVTVKEMKFRNDPMIRLYDRTQDWLQERGRPAFIAAGVIVGLVVLYLAGSYFFEYRRARAAEKFAAAYEKYNAPVADSGTTTQPGLSYTDEKIKWQECAEAFERLANEEPGYYDAVARYFAGICYTRFDPDKGARLLQEAIDRGDQQTADQARLALAQHHAASDQLEKAIALYEALTNSPWFPKQTARFGLGKLYESSGDVAKAVEAYFEAAKEDRTAGTTSDAEKRLSALAPERVKELPPPASTLPTP